MTRQQKIELILWRARELAARGHQPTAIETTLVADGFWEATELIRQGNLSRELREAAERTRRQKA